MSSGLSFKPGQRLRDGRLFLSAKNNGERLARGCLLLNWISSPLESGSAPKLGVITAKKLGNAVERTRARRLLREAFRLHQHKLKEKTLVILIARASIKGRKFSEVETDYLAALRAARLLKNPA